MEEILRDISVFITSPILSIIISDVVYLIGCYWIRPRTPPKTWWKHWKILTVLFLIIFFVLISNEMERPFIKGENFNSLTKMEGTLLYTEDDGLFLVTLDSDNERKYFPIPGHLFTYEANLRNYTNQFVTIWQKYHVVYQFECDGSIIYSLEESNRKIWISFIWDLILFYSTPFCLSLMCYFAFLKIFKDMEEGI